MGMGEHNDLQVQQPASLLCIEQNWRAGAGRGAASATMYTTHWAHKGVYHPPIPHTLRRITKELLLRAAPRALRQKSSSLSQHALESAPSRAARQGPAKGLAQDPARYGWAGQGLDKSFLRKWYTFPLDMGPIHPAASDVFPLIRRGVVSHQQVRVLF